MFDRLGSAAAGSDGALGDQEPGTHVSQSWYGMLLTQCMALQTSTLRRRINQRKMSERATDGTSQAPQLCWRTA